VTARDPQSTVRANRVKRAFWSHGTALAVELVKELGDEGGTLSIRVELIVSE